MSKPATIRNSIRKLTKLYNIAVSKELSELGFTMPQMMVIKEIIQERKTIGQISKALDLSYSTVSGIIDRLERGGFVARVKDQQDRRVIWIERTCKLEENSDRLNVYQETFYAEMLSGVTEEEVDSFIRTLQILLNHMEKKAEEKS
ncbi:MarR family winged helix-turn-helix transcriptional regulator [Brevibacillus fluminis]|uniref:MarR family winged helix-turn-helix transcriptional regulator n=1 Tax=Brevibacillus fluminis TaxID=511487 RepID=UPI003F8B4D90